jgi:predicted GH43/DUF377 family glycosyl hydrolase
VSADGNDFSGMTIGSSNGSQSTSSTQTTRSTNDFISVVPPLDGSIVTRSAIHLFPDHRRVITRPFLPGQEFLIQGISRAESVIERLLAMSDEEVESTLTATIAQFDRRHADLLTVFREHFSLIAHRLPLVNVQPDAVDQTRRDLIGAYFTQEYAVEGAALFNPSIVAHPDQTELNPGELRFIMSARAVGEGHVSSVEFRTGVITGIHKLEIDPPGRFLTAGTTMPLPMSRDFLSDSLSRQGDAISAESILRLLPDEFTPRDLELILRSSEADSPRRDAHDGILERIRRTAESSFCLTFDPISKLSERVIFPSSPAESHGMEDARFVRFVDDDFAAQSVSFEPVAHENLVTYYGTYTAFDGAKVAPHMLKTRDFTTFEIQPMIGAAAQNKGMALFPRKIDGEFWGISRWDRENISVATSPDTLRWGQPVVVQAPVHSWEVVQLGACTSPMETDVGWLVLTHGVGPMRVYSIGALLLDINDPTQVIGQLETPLLSPQGDEREGYVPNVIYSCGALIHQGVVVLPYGCSDASIRFAFVDLEGLLALLTESPLGSRTPLPTGEAA